MNINNCNSIPQISIIIPVYNSEKYLKQCLESIVNQTFSDFEVICVNDGSTDKSLYILENFQERDSRIKVISQDNMGAGYARNRGIEVAKGRYLLFLDSDDFFEINMLESLVGAVSDKFSDILVFDAWYNNGSGEDEQVMFLLDENVAKSFPVTFSYKDNPDKIFNFTTACVWNKLYSREFIVNSGIRFTDKYENISCTDDIFFAMATMVKASKITVLKKRLVHYRTGNEQSQEGRWVNSYTRHYTAINAVEKYLKENSIFDIVKKSFVNYVFPLYFNMLDKINDEKAFVRWYKILKNEIYKFGLDKNGEEYFYIKYYFHKLKKILLYSDTEYLFNELKKIKVLGNYFYPLPFEMIKKYKKVVLYGAGNVGKSYFNQLMLYNEKIETVLWVDSRYETIEKINSFPISNPDNIIYNEFDCVLIGILDEKAENHIREYLIKLGVPNDKIIWRVYD